MMRGVYRLRTRGLGLVFLGAAVMVGCAPQNDADSGDGAVAEGSGETVSVVSAPACQYTVSGAELAERPSVPDSAEAQLGDGMVKVCYSGPAARGRQVMGELVPYGQPWRLGANEPTTVHVTVPAEIGTVRVEPGSYSLYAIPGETEWTIVVNRATDRWGIPINAEVRVEDIGTFTAPSTATDQQVERFSIELESADAGAAQMVIEWEGTRVSFPIRPAAG